MTQLLAGVKPNAVTRDPALVEPTYSEGTLNPTGGQNNCQAGKPYAGSVLRQTGDFFQGVDLSTPLWFISAHEQCVKILDNDITHSTNSQIQGYVRQFVISSYTHSSEGDSA